MKKSVLLLGLLVSSLAASAQWVTQPVSYPAPTYFNFSISAVDANVAWTTMLDRGQDGPTLNFARTANGGTTWATGTVPGLIGSEVITDLYAQSATTAWVTVGTDFNTATQGRLIKTTDGGTTWTTVLSFGASVPVYVRFFNATQGVVIGDVVQGRPVIYTTADGGATWTAVPAANIPTLQSNEQLYQLIPLISSTGNSLWFATSRGQVLYTTNAGQNWSISSLGINTNNEDLEAMAFRDATNGLVMLDDGQLLRTTNGGASWSRLQPTGAFHTLGLDAIPGTRTYVATGAAGTGTGTGPGFGTGAGSSFSTDDGQTWTPIETSLNHGLVDFVSPTVGWSGNLIMSAIGDVAGGAGMNKYTGVALAAARPQTLAVQVTPNPSPDGRFRVALPVGAASTLRVHDALGRVVLEQNLAATTVGTCTIDLNGYRAGVYTLDVRSAQGEARQKLVVQ